MLEELDEIKEFNQFVMKVNKMLDQLYSYNLSQSEIALRLSVTDRTVRKWENGECLPKLQVFFRLIKLCKKMEAEKQKL